MEYRAQPGDEIKYQNSDDIFHLASQKKKKQSLNNSFLSEKADHLHSQKRWDS